MKVVAEKNLKTKKRAAERFESSGEERRRTSRGYSLETKCYLHGKKLDLENRELQDKMPRYNRNSFFMVWKMQSVGFSKRTEILLFPREIE